MFKELQEKLISVLGSDFLIHSAHPLSGGDINQVFKLLTTEGSLCIKLNEATRYPEMFKREAEGLELLRNHSAFTIPTVLDYGEFGQQNYLLMTYLDSGPKQANFWGNFGMKLAEMHQSTQHQFGLKTSNFIGSLTQSNTYCSNWSEFYATQRLIPQGKLAVKQGYLHPDSFERLQQLCEQLNKLFPQEQPALLHGDLWSGNYMIDQKGEPALIDPAVYFGHREMDLGMMHLFGGYPPQVFDVYNHYYPLDSEWKERIPLAQLYPLLVHLNLFGIGYLSQVDEVINQYL